MSAEPAAPPERAGAKEWTALAVLGVPAVLVMMNMSVLYLALPTLSRDLGPAAPSCCGSPTSTASWSPVP